MKIRLFITQDLIQNAQITIEREQTHYLKNVLRRKVSDEIHFFNGKDGEWHGNIIVINNKHSVASINKQTRKQKNSPDVWLIFAKVKRNPTELIVQKATELGASRIIPVFTQFSEGKSANTERFEQISIEAAEQSDRMDIPEIQEPEKLSTLIQGWDQSRKLLFCDESGSGKPINSQLRNFNTGEKWAIIIGPEGGFSTSELEMLRKLPYAVPVGLGPRILKAETAAIAALTCWQSILGDWNESPKFESRE